MKTVRIKAERARSADGKYDVYLITVGEGESTMMFKRKTDARPPIYVRDLWGDAADKIAPRMLVRAFDLREVTSPLFSAAEEIRIEARIPEIEPC